MEKANVRNLKYWIKKYQTNIFKNVNNIEHSTSAGINASVFLRNIEKIVASYIGIIIRLLNYNFKNDKYTHLFYGNRTMSCLKYYGIMNMYTENHENLNSMS